MERWLPEVENCTAMDIFKLSKADGYALIGDFLRSYRLGYITEFDAQRWIY